MRGEPWKTIRLAARATTMATTLHTLASMPTARPERMVVADPVWVDSAISSTGLRLMDVNSEVSGLKTTANPTPMAFNVANCHSPA